MYSKFPSPVQNLSFNHISQLINSINLDSLKFTMPYFPHDSYSCMLISQ